MNKKTKITNINFFIWLTFLSLLVYSCELFNTRDPENPDTSRPSYIPPTSPELVLQNMLNAFTSKNVDNYMNSFADKTFDEFSIIFEAASDANAQFPGIFQTWDLNSERRSFESMSHNIADGIFPELKFDNIFPTYVQPDSAILVTNYTIKVNHQRSDIPQNYSGTLQFNLKIRTGGLWCISHWIDTAPSQSDTTGGSWSLMKAWFY